MKTSSKMPGMAVNGENSLSEADQAIYEKCLTAGGPLSQDQLQSFLPANNNSIESMSRTLNLLLSRRLLEALQLNGVLFYRAVTQTEAERLDKMEIDEALIYSSIKAAGDEGIWSKKIRTKANLHPNVVKRWLKVLESKSLVKSVRSVQYPTRIFYMLYDLTPSIEVSGGPWFTDSELDVEFVTKLSNAIERYIQTKSKPKDTNYEKLYPATNSGFPTAEKIHSWLKGTGLTDVKLAISHIVALLDVLIYDGKIERRADGMTYKAVNTLIDNQRNNAFTEMPCGQCPVFSLCQEGGVVSPEGCAYWQDWLAHNL